MHIHVSSGIGAGPTKLSAFDAALYDAGVANYNLLQLSSVIPASTEIIVHENDSKPTAPGTWGDRLYVVLADMRVEKPNEEAWAGIGWVQDPRTKRGLFVEHSGKSEETVRRDITQSLEALMAIRNIDFGPIQMKVVGRRCTFQPVCALVAAIYQASDWHNQPYILGE